MSLLDTLLDAAMPVLWPEPGSGAVIAVSGGRDSVVLARMLGPRLRARGVPTVVAHLDHGWRGEHGFDEEAFVRQVADDLELPAVVGRVAPRPERVRRIGREADARASRRDFLTRVAGERSASTVFLGHHQDDQVETILCRRARGAPSERAASMASLAGLFARPLLQVPGSLLLEEARSAGWTWREDPSNGDLRLLRNRIRADLARRPMCAARRDELLAQGAAARARLDAEAADRQGLILPRGTEGLELVAWLAAPLPVAITSVQSLASGIGRPSAQAILGFRTCLLRLGSCRRWDLGDGVVGHVVAGRLRVEDANATPPEPPDVGCRVVLGAEARDLLRSPGLGADFAVFDAAGLAHSRVIAPLDGVRIRPYGVSGTRKVRDLLREAGVDPVRRAQWPLVVDERGSVLWIPGVRASNDAPVTEATTSALLFYTAPPRAHGASEFEAAPA